MPTFTYIGQTLDGKQQRGSIEARSAEDAREMLRKRGMMVEHVTEAVGFVPVETHIDASSEAHVTPPASAEVHPDYVPLSDTFRLYAGWLMAWYSIVYLIGSYQYTKRLPFEIPFLEGLFLSPLVLKFAFGTFLFLLLSSVHRILGRGIGKGIVLTVVWAILMTVFSLNA
jgi:hypothetical protein